MENVAVIIKWNGSQNMMQQKQLIPKSLSSRYLRENSFYFFFFEFLKLPDLSRVSRSHQKFPAALNARTEVWGPSICKAEAKLWNLLCKGKVKLFLKKNFIRSVFFLLSLSIAFPHRSSVMGGKSFYSSNVSRTFNKVRWLMQSKFLQRIDVFLSESSWAQWH